MSSRSGNWRVGGAVVCGCRCCGWRDEGRKDGQSGQLTAILSMHVRHPPPHKQSMAHSQRGRQARQADNQQAGRQADRQAGRQAGRQPTRRQAGRQARQASQAGRQAGRQARQAGQAGAFVRTRRPCASFRWRSWCGSRCRSSRPARAWGQGTPDVGVVGIGFCRRSQTIGDHAPPPNEPRPQIKSSHRVDTDARTGRTPARRQAGRQAGRHRCLRLTDNKGGFPQTDPLWTPPPRLYRDAHRDAKGLADALEDVAGDPHLVAGLDADAGPDLVLPLPGEHLLQ